LRILAVPSNFKAYHDSARGPLNLKHTGSDAIGVLSANFGSLGYVIVGLSAANSIVSMAIYRIKNNDEIEIS